MPSWRVSAESGPRIATTNRRQSEYPGGGMIHVLDALMEDIDRDAVIRPDLGSVEEGDGRPNDASGG